MATLYSFTNSAQDLDAYRWDKRLLVITSPVENNEEARQQWKLLEPVQDEMTERKLQVIHLTSSSIKDGWNSDWKEIDANQDRKLDTSGFQVVLIGLDGGVKLRKDQPVQPMEIFNLIDSMPMRRAEMRNQP